MEEKTYKWHKCGYGSGDIAGNVVYAFLSSFIVDLPDKYNWLKFRNRWHINCSIKLFDGITDIFLEP